MSVTIEQEFVSFDGKIDPDPENMVLKLAGTVWKFRMIVPGTSFM